MITGFNTDVKHRGVVYHVQTEDKGTANPMIETLIYKGGEILGSRRLPYANLAKVGDEPAITKLMEDQHKAMIIEVKRGRFDPAGANQLLDAVGYRKGPDGWRNLPDGKPFTIRYASRPDSLGRQLDELWKKALDSISVRMEVQKDKFPELLKLERQCKLMMRTASWIADYPDADNFMQLLYGKNIGQNNNGCAKIPEYDKLYEQTTRMPPSPERDRLYHEMTRLIEVYAPWRLDVLTYRNMLVSPRVQGYKKHPILHAEWQFVDIGKPAAGVPSAAGGKAAPD